MDLYKQGKFDKAIDDYNKALAIKPKYALAYVARGIAWYRKDKYDKAIGDQSQALRLNPNIVAAYNNRGLAFSAKGEYNKAIADFTQALAIESSPGDQSRRRQHCHLVQQSRKRVEKEGRLRPRPSRTTTKP